MTDKTPADLNIQFLGDMQRLVLNPGDILVLRIPIPIGAKQMDALEVKLRYCFPDHRCLILEGADMQLGVLSEANADQTLAGLMSLSTEEQHGTAKTDH